MAFQVTYTTTFKAGAPGYDEWTRGLASSEITGAGDRSPSEIFDNRVTEVLDPVVGFISSEVTTNGNTNVLVETWESQQAYEEAMMRVKTSGAGTISASADSAVVTGVGTAFTSEVAVGEVLCDCTTGRVDIGIVASVESDVSLTLSDLAFDCTNVVYETRKDTTADNSLYDLYAATYIESAEVTPATV